MKRISDKRRALSVGADQRRRLLGRESLGMGYRVQAIGGATVNIKDLEAKCRAKIFKCKGLMTSPHLNEVCADEILIIQLIEERRLLARLADANTGPSPINVSDYGQLIQLRDRVLQEIAECKS